MCARRSSRIEVAVLESVFFLQLSSKHPESLEKGRWWPSGAIRAATGRYSIKNLQAGGIDIVACPQQSAPTDPI